MTERRLRLAGVLTAVLEGGDGPPVVLLHGPGEFAAKWLQVIPDLARTNRVIAPDLPAHGEPEPFGGPPEIDRVVAWLDDLIESTCGMPPVLVGQTIGGAMAAHFALHRGDRVSGLVLGSGSDAHRGSHDAHLGTTRSGHTGVGRRGHTRARWVAPPRDRERRRRSAPGTTRGVPPGLARRAA